MIELLITISIMAFLMVLLVPNVNKSLDKNKLAEDAAVFKSKLEQTRLLAGSTQNVDETAPNADTTKDSTGYYALYVPADASNNWFAILRLSFPLTDGECKPDIAIGQAKNSGKGSCVVEKIDLASTRLTTTPDSWLIGYRVPTQKLVNIVDTEAKLPIFTAADGTPQTILRLQYQDKIATVTIDDYTGRVNVTFN